MNAAKTSRKCKNCGRAVDWCEGRAHQCLDCLDSTNRTRDAIRAVAREWAADRKRARGGTPGRFRLRASVFADYIGFGSCEDRQEAMDEACRILAVFPEAARVKIEESACCTVERDGTVSAPDAIAGLPPNSTHGEASVASPAGSARARTSEPPDGSTRSDSTASVISMKDLADLARLRDELGALLGRITDSRVRAGRRAVGGAA